VQRQESTTNINEQNITWYSFQADTGLQAAWTDPINSTGLVAIDLGFLKTGGAMHEVGAPLSGLEFHFVRRLR
jgi:hypothetical protein